FVLSYHRATLALPSFPTRRSSDLLVRLIFKGIRNSRLSFVTILDCIEADRRYKVIPTAPTPSRAATATSAMKNLLANFFTLPTRSEEHTSELQSRSDLVCRLLLEK